MKWSFEEDYIVCKFYLENVETRKENIDDLMAILQNRGFGSREKGSVKMRIQNIEHVRTGRGLSNVAKQTKEIYDGITGLMRNSSRTAQLSAYVKNNYSLAATSSPVSDTNLFIMTQPMGQKFSDVLLGFIDARGLKDSEVYNSVYMSRSTFNDIKNNKYNPSIEKVMVLCVGLKLSYNDSVKLMAAAGYVFRNNNMTDIIVKWHLEQKIYSAVEINCALYEYNLKLLF